MIKIISVGETDAIIGRVLGDDGFRRADVGRLLQWLQISTKLCLWGGEEGINKKTY